MPLDQDIILTKLLPPTNSGRVVHRSQFDHLITEQPQCPVTLICAPAGYGKSTLMSEWHQNLNGQNSLTCWLSLEQEENNAFALLTYFIAALTHANAISGVIARSQLLNWNAERSTTIIAALMREIAEQPSSIVMFIDDYHAVDTPAIARIMETLINQSPDNFSLIIASRKRPQFSIGSLKVHHRLMEINANSLRFSEQDVAQFIGQQLSTPLDEQTIHKITQQTEGWPAAIQLVTLALMGTSNQQEILNKISGNVLDIADYLAKDVLGNLTSEMRQFLLHTAVLNRFQPELCDCINPGQNNRQLIDQCLQQNLFLIPLDQTRGWYRYHYLFREFLLNQLAINHPKKLHELHRLASHWFAEKGLIDDAVSHAIEGQDFPFLTELVERHAKQFITRGHMTQVLEWINRIPADLMADRPTIPGYKCCALFHMRRPTEAAEALREAEQRLDELEARGESIPGLREELNVYRSGTAVAADDVVRAKAVALQPLSAAVEPFIHGAQQNILGYCHFAEGEYQLAREALARGNIYHAQCNSTYGIVYSQCFSALVEMAIGDLPRAEQLFSLAEKTAELEESWRSYISAEPSLYRGCILYEWNQIEDARELLEQNLPYVEECSQASAPVLGHIVMAKICWRDDNRSEAYAHLARAQSICQSANLKYQRLLVANEQIRLLIAEGQVYRALATANLLGIQPHSEAPEPMPQGWERESGFKLLIKSRLLLGLGEYTEALLLVDQLLTLAEKTETRRPQLLLYIMKAQAELMLEQKGLAYRTICSAIEKAQTGPYFSLFLEEAPFVFKLVAASPNQEGMSIAGKHFLAQLEKPNTPTKNSPKTISESEKLSQREVEILVLISQGKTNHQIAEKLFIADNTVKWHLKNIFDKLEVRNRTSAVFVGKAMGIIK
ncbi:MAG: LuxR C-terminal-related transcriptional regulator [Pseudomonadales bacterium]|nr:LuxR C-terminal-related transcriptional regulator [Pseudomonadales bacterium]